MTSRPMPGNSNEAAGYIVHTNEAIYGTGLTVHEAMLDAREWLDPDRDPLTDPDVKVSVASQALLDEVAKRGGAIAWGERRGVCCTVAEAESH